jgi:hypothetical protein
MSEIAENAREKRVKAAVNSSAKTIPFVKYFCTSGSVSALAVRLSSHKTQNFTLQPARKAQRVSRSKTQRFFLNLGAS